MRIHPVSYVEKLLPGLVNETRYYATKSNTGISTSQEHWHVVRTRGIIVNGLTCPAISPLFSINGGDGNFAGLNGKALIAEGLNEDQPPF